MDGLNLLNFLGFKEKDERSRGDIKEDRDRS